MKETADAKQRLGREAALKLASAASTIVATRGRSTVRLSLRGDRPDEATLLAHLLGPTGNLRAPTLRVGKTLLVGFDEEAYRKVLKL